MGRMESALREEIARLARKEVKNATDPLRKQIKGLKVALRKIRREARNGARVQTKKTGLDLHASAREVAETRIGPRWIKALRKRHTLSQNQLADILEVSMSAVGSWEYGRAKPAGANREALVALRKLKPGELKAMMAGTTLESGKK